MKQRAGLVSIHVEPEYCAGYFGDIRLYNIFIQNLCQFLIFPENRNIPVHAYVPAWRGGKLCVVVILMYSFTLSSLSLSLQSDTSSLDHERGI